MSQTLSEILDELRNIDDRDLKYDLLIEYADRFIEVPKEVASRPFSESHKAPACESEAYVWLAVRKDKTAQLYFAVENPQGISAKALAVILSEGLNGHALSEVTKVSEEIVYDIFGRSISMGKGQGLMGMIRLMKSLAVRLS